MSIIIFIVLLIQIFWFQTFAFIGPSRITMENKIKPLSMSLKDNNDPENEFDPNSVAKEFDANTKDSVDVTFTLAKEYHKYLLKYGILTKEDINSITKINLDLDNPISFEKIMLNSESNDIKIAKHRLKNYLIFEKNWVLLNKIKKESGLNFKLGINKYLDSIEFDPKDLRSKEKPKDLMKNEIKKNVKFSPKMIKNIFNRQIDNTKNYINKATCMLEIIKGIFGIGKSDTKLKESKESYPYIDWSKNGMTTYVKDQGQCGSCWAFSAVSTLESYMRIKGKSNETLSEQELVDCSKQDYGCNGGFMDTAYDYVIENNGLHSSIDYPYTAKDGECKANCCNEYKDFFDENKNIEVEVKPSKSTKSSSVILNNVSDLKLHRRVPGSKFSEYRFFYPESVDDIKKSLQLGPVAIALDANSFFFRFYESGVIDLPSEYSYGLNHAVMLVGFDKDSEGEHWIIQNSWGSEWGDKGFVRLRIREGEGTLLCQIYGVYPYN